MTKPSANGLKETIENLIKAGTTFDIKELELIYHKELKVIMMDDQGKITISNKEMFKNLFQMKKENGDAPLNDWAEFHHVEVNKHNGHIIVARKVNLTGIEQKITLSIDLIWEENRWQVIREVILPST